jgi:hypothetical protein
MEILSLYYVTEDLNGELMGLKVQSLFSEGRLESLKTRAKDATMKFIDKGLYLSRYELYRHPKGVKKPYLGKYKLDIWN